MLVPILGNVGTWERVDIVCCLWAGERVAGMQYPERRGFEAGESFVVENDWKTVGLQVQPFL